MKTILGHEVRETPEEILDPRVTALVLIDMQVGALSPTGAIGASGHSVSMFQDAVDGCKRALEAARATGVRVVHLRVANLPDGASSPAAWLRALTVGANGRPVDLTQLSVDGDPMTDIIPELQPLPGEAVVRKRRPSGFHGTDLAMILRAQGVETVAIAGIQTSICVEATLRDATHHDYYAVLLSDAVGDMEPEIHDAAMTVMRARHDVLTVDDAIAVWTGAGGRAGDAG